MKKLMRVIPIHSNYKEIIHGNGYPEGQTYLFIDEEISTDKNVLINIEASLFMSISGDKFIGKIPKKISRCLKEKRRLCSKHKYFMAMSLY